ANTQVLPQALLPSLKVIARYFLGVCVLYLVMMCKRIFSGQFSLCSFEINTTKFDSCVFLQMTSWMPLLLFIYVRRSQKMMKYPHTTAGPLLSRSHCHLTQKCSQMPQRSTRFPSRLPQAWAGECLVVFFSSS
uniref:Uncharacterized protein n=1 Tax=Gallus gallus TaxID=9031 RepID=A0A8V0XBJ0_CHICK